MGERKKIPISGITTVNILTGENILLVPSKEGYSIAIYEDFTYEYIKNGKAKESGVPQGIERPEGLHPDNG